MNPFVSDPEWGWWIVLYFYLGGIAAGAYFLGTLIELFGRSEDRPVARIGYRIAFPLVCVCGILLIVDLERPERFWHMLLQSEVVDRALREGWPLGGWATMLHAPMFKWWSPMSIGAWSLFVFGLFSFISFLRSVWPEGRIERWLGRGAVGRVLEVLGSAVGFFVASYTGVLLTATNQPLWSVTDWTGPLFLTSAASTGIAAVLLLRTASVSAESEERLERADLWVLGLELFVFLVFLASLGAVLPLAMQTWQGWVLIFGTLIVGLLLPLWLHLRVGTPDHRRVTAAALAALVGGFALRFGVVRTSPALLAVWQRHWEHTGAAPAPTPLWQTWQGLGLLATTAVLAVLIPWALRRHWRLSGAQMSLAGLVSLLVAVGVTAYSFSPDPGRILNPLSAVRFSPEEGRLRGGGPGASQQNRPSEIHLRSKLVGNLPHER